MRMKMNISTEAEYLKDLKKMRNEKYYKLYKSKIENEITRTEDLLKIMK
jgi:hypothetical protein